MTSAMPAERFSIGATPTDLPKIDRAAFAAEVTALRQELLRDTGASDLQHLRKMERWGRTCTILGYLSAPLLLNPVSALLMSLGNTARWTMVTHHVLHRGYDRIAQVPKRYQSKHFARGWRRFWDWPDWMLPAAWVHEHNHLHHMHTGELEDPDLVEHNAWLLRRPWLPRPLKWLLIALLMLTWKLLYYAPNTLCALQMQQRKAKNSSRTWRLMFPGERLWLPCSRASMQFYARCVLPYAIYRFGLLPALFLPLGTAAWLAVLLNSLLAELITNVHAFLIIVPNHAGDDVHRYLEPSRDRAEFYLRQVMGSVNYPGGKDLGDFLYGYLNYQIEHHVWPDLPMLKYRQAAPRLRAICLKHGVPYLEEPLPRRLRRLGAILMGDASMRVAQPLPSAPPTAAPTQT